MTIPWPVLGVILVVGLISFLAGQSARDLDPDEGEGRIAMGAGLMGAAAVVAIVKCAQAAGWGP